MPALETKSKIEKVKKGRFTVFETKTMIG